MPVILKTTLKDILTERDMTQKQLAELTGLRENTISEIVKNQRDVLNRYHIGRIMEVLNITDFNEILVLEEE